jgi:DNA helicase IV
MAGYYFQLPTQTDLTYAQQSAVNETRPIALSGGPGTGKSVVSLWRHINCHNRGVKSLLLTYTVSLKEYLKQSARTQAPAAANAVYTSIAGQHRCANYEEVIIDEAQDQNDEYYRNVKSMCSKVTYGADDAQIAYPDHCCTNSELRDLFPTNVRCILDQNFRSTYYIMSFVKQAFPNAFISQDVLDDLADRGRMGSKPNYMIYNDGGYQQESYKQKQAIRDIINRFKGDTHNIAILVPWKNDVQKYADMLQSMGFDGYSYYYEGCSDGMAGINNLHVTTFKSAKGLEFDTVIIPDFDKYPRICGNYNIDWKDFYIGVTRAKMNLYLLSSQSNPSYAQSVNISRL